MAVYILFYFRLFAYILNHNGCFSSHIQSFIASLIPTCLVAPYICPLYPFSIPSRFFSRHPSSLFTSFVLYHYPTIDLLLEDSPAQAGCCRGDAPRILYRFRIHEACLPLRLSVCLSACLFAGLSVCLSACLSAALPVRASVRPAIRLNIVVVAVNITMNSPSVCTS